MNGSIDSDDVEWYRLVKGTKTVRRILNARDDFIDVPIPSQNSFTTILYIYNARKPFTGYYWVRSPLGDVCNTSFTVSTGMFALHVRICNCVQFCTYIHVIVVTWAYISGKS